MSELCYPDACGRCPLLGLCGDPTDLPPELDAPDVDPNEPAPEGGCCGGGCCK